MMSSSSSSSRVRKSYSSKMDEDGNEVRRGPWTLEEDNLLIQHITSHGEGQWNSLSKSAGLKRTGKSCRLRWLNYLKPDIKRGNLTPHEQLLILELHSRWGNRWSKIAQHMPGRTDNEIKNYWRTRVQKQARQLKVDSNSNNFLQAVRLYWMPRLLEKIQQTNATSSPSSSTSETPSLTVTAPVLPPPCPKSDGGAAVIHSDDSGHEMQDTMYNGFFTSFDQDGCYHVDTPGCHVRGLGYDQETMCMSDCHVEDGDWFADEIGSSSFWNSDELWEFRKVNV